MSVALLTRKIQNELADFGPISVQGELSQVKVSANGHLYATLKDHDASISLVMWRNVVVRQRQLPKEGEEVVVRGSLSVYAPRGQYQLTITSVQALGQGDLAAQFEALRQRLSESGLFDEEHKQPLPFLPRAVGLVTASGSAALADMLHGLQERFPRMPIIHAPAQVQGPNAKHEIVAALRALDKHPEVDVIICGRGGGSLEDLWSFNEEMVVRAIAACKTPVVSAVGHETDTSLADFVADVRAKTPTAAAEMVVPESQALYEELADYAETMYDAVAERLQSARLEWQAYATHRALTGPAYQLSMRRQRFDELTERLQMHVQRKLTDAQQRVSHLGQALKGSSPRRQYEQKQQQLQFLQKQLRQLVAQQLRQAVQAWQAKAGRLADLSPLNILKRGYAVVQNEHGEVLHKHTQVQAGDKIHAQLGEGFVSAEVKKSGAKSPTFKKKS